MMKFFRCVFSGFFIFVKMKTKNYFDHTRNREDRSFIKDEWIEFVVNYPEHEVIQSDGRIKRWARIFEYENRFLRVILLDDNETIHNAFFDRSFRIENEN